MPAAHGRCPVLGAMGGYIMGTSLLWQADAQLQDAVRRHLEWDLEATRGDGPAWAGCFERSVLPQRQDVCACWVCCRA
jgi:hypothetical protein